MMFSVGEIRAQVGRVRNARSVWSAELPLTRRKSGAQQKESAQHPHHRIILRDSEPIQDAIFAYLIR